MSCIHVEVTILDGQDLLDEFFGPDEQAEMGDAILQTIRSEDFKILEVKVDGRIVRRTCDLEPTWIIKQAPIHGSNGHFLLLQDTWTTL